MHNVYRESHGVRARIDEEKNGMINVCIRGVRRSGWAGLLWVVVE